MQIADLHIHSKYSRATSRDCDIPHLDKWARNKGIHIIGAGDFTHPGWRKELLESLLPAEEGFYTLREELRLPADIQESGAAPRFVVSGEISTIYKKDGKTRKVHHLFLLPSIEAAERLSHKLEAIGNLRSDGRPILGLDSHDLLEIALENCPSLLYIPAHIWTPHFSVFGAFSGFNTLKECYGDLTPYVHGLETGLSSDPSMIRRLSALDGYTLVSHSDAHSPGKLGREANLLSIELSYPCMARAIQTGEGFMGTLEFFPEEGKYHLDGHRDCGLCLEPAETLRLNGKCPVCGRKITIGVLHRLEELADRPEATPSQLTKPFESLIPLPELIASCIGASVVSKKTQARYFELLRKLGPEFHILRDATFSEIEKAAGYAIAEGVRRMRVGQVYRKSGFDGEYGVISLFAPHEFEAMRGQLSMFAPEETPVAKPKKSPHPSRKPSAVESMPEQTKKKTPALSPLDELNLEQRLAVNTLEKNVAVIAGPGTGKTKTLVSRIAYLLEELGTSPAEITAVTFTRQAATEMRERLEARLGKKTTRGLTIGTFHSVCLGLLERKPLIGERQALELMRSVLKEQGDHSPPLPTLRKISLVKNGETCLRAGLDAQLYAAYCARLIDLNVRDLDDLLLHALQQAPGPGFTHLLVDEFQDISALQRKLIRHWHLQTLFVIGDPDQSIYGFRGANAECFTELARDIPSLHVISLEQNYRSTRPILKGALALISHNPGHSRVLRANRPEGAPVRLIKFPRPFEESVWIAKEIGRMVGGVDMLSASSTGQGRHARRSFSDIAVLCRTRRQLERVEACLSHDDIPCVIHGREDYLSDKKVIASLGFFDSLLHPEDDLSLEDCLRTLWRLPKALIQQAVIAMAQAATGSELDVDLLLGRLSAFAPFAPWLASVQAYLPRLPKEKPRLLLQSFVDEHGKNAALERLMQASVFHEDMEGFLRTLLLGEESDICRAALKTYTTDAVRLMTLHGSKGLEFPVVFLVADHMLPEGREPAAETVQEERRLFFVGMTRAREELILTSAESPLRFLGELSGVVQEESTEKKASKPRMEQLRLI